jgi:hypothetical protein
VSWIYSGKGMVDNRKSAIRQRFDNLDRDHHRRDESIRRNGNNCERHPIVV